MSLQDDQLIADDQTERASFEFIATEDNDVDSLKLKLKEAYDVIFEKERDLYIAAEAGNNLLTSNNKLQEDYDNLLQRCLAAEDEQYRMETSLKKEEDELERRDSLRTVGGGEEMTITSAVVAAFASNEKAQLGNLLDDLERNNFDLQSRLSVVSDQARDDEHKNERKLSELKKDLEAAKREIEGWVQRGHEFEEEKKRFARERSNLIKERKEASAADLEMDQLTNKVAELESLNRNLTSTKSECERRLAAVRDDKSRLEEKCIELREELEDCRDLKKDYEEQNTQMNELNARLEESQETNNLLQVALQKLTPEADVEEDQGGKTMFSEVEDRRMRLENKHQNLSQKHVVLMKAHSMTVHQQERMKNHISRLTQLSNSSSNENRMQRLEQALGQSQSENQQLQTKIQQLEKTQKYQNLLLPSAASSSSRAAETTGQLNVNANEVIECLRFQVDQLSNDAKSLRSELRTSQMLKLGESDKVRRYEGLLQSKESETEQLRSSYAHMKYELDELRLAQQRRKKDSERKTGDDEDDSSSLVIGDTRHRSTQTVSPPSVSVESQMSQTDTPRTNATGSQTEILDDPQRYTSQPLKGDSSHINNIPASGSPTVGHALKRRIENVISPDRGRRRSSKGLNVDDHDNDNDADDVKDEPADFDGDSMEMEMSNPENSDEDGGMDEDTGHRSIDGRVVPGPEDNPPSKENKDPLVAPSFRGSPHPRKLFHPVSVSPTAEIKAEKKKPKQVYVKRQQVQNNDCKQQ